MSSTFARPSVHARRGFSAADLFWLIFILMMLMAILLPSLSRARELSKRSVCAANLKCLGTACHIYANDNREWFPTVAYRFADPKSPTNDHPVMFIGQISANMTQNLTPETSDKASVTRSTFLLIINGGSTPDQFVCPSSGDKPDDLRNPREKDMLAAQPGVNRFDFKGYPYISYGYQLPFGPKGRPNFGLDPQMAIMAEKGPCFEAGHPELTSNENVAKSSPPIVREQRSAAEVPKLASREDAQKAPPASWRPFNSRNHGGEGQNVLYLDCHVEFRKSPIAGVDGDNIYTMQSGHTAADIMNGLKPDDKKGPLTNTDSIIVP